MSDVHSRIPWNEGEWFNTPSDVAIDGDALIVTAAEGSDLWRTTAYGFVHDNAHALLRPFREGSAVEVSFVLDFEAQFDQAGILVREDEIHWLKAGMEISEEVAQVGAVATRGMSDWSLAPVPEWHGGIVTVRVSWTGDALTVRARSGTSAWRLVRVSPWTPSSSTVMAGAYLAAPTRADCAYGSPNGRLARRMPSCTPSGQFSEHAWSHVATTSSCPNRSCFVQPHWRQRGTADRRRGRCKTQGCGDG